MTTLTDPGEILSPSPPCALCRYVDVFIPGDHCHAFKYHEMTGCRILPPRAFPGKQPEVKNGTE
jgi:hypothetical protein